MAIENEFQYRVTREAASRLASELAVFLATLITVAGQIAYEAHLVAPEVFALTR